MIRFLLNREEVTICDSRADETVLDYLRERRQKYGTKEGCASGDCGACTVVVAEVRDGALTYRAINSCITFLGALHGMQLITVEDLGDDGTYSDSVGDRHDDGTYSDGLHPVQQAMVDYHGAQCGFCTPGFVMSLFALYKNHSPAAEKTPASRHDIEEALGGNLCRCTGYRPIVDAAVHATRAVAPDHFTADATRCIKRLNAINADTVTGGAFHLPSSAAELAALIKQKPTARLLAGGTDLALEVTQQLHAIDDIICLNRVAELTDITRDDAHLTIGAAVTLRDCGAALCDACPHLAELLQRFGGAQIRNQATVGGNVANASPVADLSPVLIALDAVLVLQCGDDVRELAAEDFFLDYKKTALAKNEFIRGMRLPLAKNKFVRAYKVSKRRDDDISAVCAVFSAVFNDTVTGWDSGTSITDIRIAFGGMAAIPKRAGGCESALRGQAMNAASLKNAQRALAKEFQPISDVRAGAAYRMTVAQNLVQRFFMDAQ